MVKIGFSLQKQYESPITQVIQLLSTAGFSAISPAWSSELDLNLIASCADKYNMEIQSLHAPHVKSALLWDSKEPLAYKFQKSITDCIIDCANFKIPTIVIHGWGGFDYNFQAESLDFKVFDQIVDFAEEKGISIAFENLEGEEFLEALLNHYTDRKHVGYCWDSGHDHCYPHKLNFLESFGSRLIMTHIHDNLGLRNSDGIPSGNDDLHFLPFDGNIDWANTLFRLKNLPKQKILNFELKKRSASTAPNDLIYDQLSIEEYIKLAGEKCRKIANMYEKAIK